MTVGVYYQNWYSPFRHSLRIVPGGAASTGRTATVTRASETLLALRDLPDAALRLRRPIEVRIWWEPASGAFVAGEGLLGQWFGSGPSQEAALRDLGEVLTEVFHELASDPAELAGSLRRDYEELRQVIAYADQV